LIWINIHQEWWCFICSLRFPKGGPHVVPDHRIDALRKHLGTGIELAMEKGWWSYPTAFPLADLSVITDELDQRKLLKTIAVVLLPQDMDEPDRWEILIADMRKDQDLGHDGMHLTFDHREHGWRGRIEGSC
jgi:hypothetical protein